MTRPPRPGYDPGPATRRTSRPDPRNGSRSPPLPPRLESIALGALLALAFALRAIAVDQPIVENYVGRQIPTAMVARNLERGSGFLRPRLDTLPAPNLFLVEPPLYAEAVVAFRRASGLALGPSGRLVSALGVALGCWGLFGLVRRREGPGAALWAVGAFAIFPVTIRYGRAFQPDALMLGTLLVALRAWDEREAGARRAWMALGWGLLALGLALKITSAFVLVPLIAVILRRRDVRTVVLVLSAVLPAFLWYLHASALLAEGTGSGAGAENEAIWLRVLVPSALWRRETAVLAGRYLFVRAFTPLGAALAFWGLARPGSGRRLWAVWGVAGLAAMLVLAAKLHHEYYWLALAPVAAAGVGRALADLGRRGRWGALGAATLAIGLAALSAFQSRSTFETPPQWASLRSAAAEVRAHVPPGAWLVAPEALLFAADRKGCRLELSRAAAERAAREWGRGTAVADPVDLVEFYRARGARYFADVGGSSPARSALHGAVRRRYNVLVDRPGVLVAALSAPEPRNAPGWPPPRTP